MYNQVVTDASVVWGKQTRHTPLSLGWEAAQTENESQRCIEGSEISMQSLIECCGVFGNMLPGLGLVEAFDSSTRWYTHLAFTV